MTASPAQTQPWLASARTAPTRCPTSPRASVCPTTSHPTTPARWRRLYDVRHRFGLGTSRFTYVVDDAGVIQERAPQRVRHEEPRPERAQNTGSAPQRPGVVPSPLTRSFRRPYPSFQRKLESRWPTGHTAKTSTRPVATPDALSSYHFGLPNGCGIIGACTR